MKKQASYIVSSYGCLWRIRHSKMVKMLNKVANGESVDLNDYGRVLGIEDYNLTNLDKDMAIEILKDET